MGDNGFYQFHYYYIPRVSYGLRDRTDGPKNPTLALWARRANQTRPVEVLRTRRHTGHRPSFLTVGLAITDFINFTTIIFRMSAMDWEIEPMGPKIRLWPCEPAGRSQTRPVEILRAHRHTGRRPSCPSVGWAITDFINFTAIIYRINIERDSWRWWGLWKRLRAPQSAVACRLSEAPSPFLPFTSCVFGI